MEKWSFQRTRELMTPRALRGMAVNEVGRARISMMVRSTSSNSRPDTLVQDRTPQPHGFLLQRTAGPYIGVKHFQTIHHCTVSMSLTGSCFSSELAPRPFHHGIRERGGTIYATALPLATAGPSGHANSPHPSSREGHHSTTRWSSSFLLLDLIPHGFHAAAAACSRVQRNSVPSTQMRCMITANRRASATIAFFIPRRLAICIAQALSQDHFFECTHALSRLVEHDPHHLISTARYSAVPIHLARLILGARQPKHRTDGLGFAEPSRYVDGGAIGQRHHRADTRGRHQAPAHFVVPDDGQQPAMQDDELLA